MAVVTGGANGIGRALGERFAQAGMRIALFDFDGGALRRTAGELEAQGIEVLSVRGDVTKPDSVQELADRVLARFGGVHILCNNAGVVADADLESVLGLEPRPMWRIALADWRWTFDVNVFGVVHGIRTFVPIMLGQDEPGHVVNTASMAGITTPGPGFAVYGASKHAVVRLSESLQLQFASRKAKIGVSVLCPEGVKTRIMSSGRIRPEDYADGSPPPDEESARDRDEVWAKRFKSGDLEPAAIAEKVFEAIQGDQFYVLPHGDDSGVRDRMEHILSRTAPGSNR